LRVTKTPSHPVIPRFAQRDRPEKTANNIGMCCNHLGSDDQIEQSASMQYGRGTPRLSK
jgi:hypothetical protein